VSSKDKVICFWIFVIIDILVAIANIITGAWGWVLVFALLAYYWAYRIDTETRGSTK
jgi:hypothetical protein